MWRHLKSSFAFWFGLSFVLAAVLALPFSVIEKGTHERLLAEGEVTDAAVVDRGQRNEDENRSHWLKFTYFDLSLNEFSHQQAVPKKLWDKHPIGSTIRVRYLRDDPQKVTPEALLGEPEWKTLLAMGITFAAIGVPMVALAMVKARRTAQA